MCVWGRWIIIISTNCNIVGSIYGSVGKGLDGWGVCVCV